MFSSMPTSTKLTFADPYEYQASIGSSGVRVIVTKRGEFQARLTRMGLHRLRVMSGWQSLASIAHIAVPTTRNVLFFLTDSQQAATTLGGIEFRPGDISSVARGGEYHHRGVGNARWGAISLEPEDLAVFGRALVGRDVRLPGATHILRSTPALVSRLLSLHNAAIHLSINSPDAAAHPVVAKAIEQELVRATIACLTEPETAESSRARRPQMEVMRRFEQIIEASPNEPLYITDICASIGVTDRTLRLHCQDHLGMNPQRYLWLRRMHLARHALASADGTVKTVTEIANDYGFGELGRFAVSYRKLYGETPSVTLRRPADDRGSVEVSRATRPISGSA
jgi:AraC-like DNA-binding protein